MKRCLAVACVLACLVRVSAFAGQPYESIQSATGDGYQTWFKQVTASGQRVIYLNGFNAGGEVRFAAVAVKDAAAIPTEVRHDLSANDYRDTLKKMSADGFRPICVSAYLSGGTPHFAAVWVKDGKPIKWEERRELTSAEYEKEIDAAREKGLRPEIISAYAIGHDEHSFAVLFTEAQGEWFAKHDLNAEQYQKLFDENRSTGFRPVSATAYATKQGMQYAAVFVKDPAVYAARHNMTESQFNTEMKQKQVGGYRLLIATAGAVPKTAEIDVFDRTMQQYMKERSIPSGTLAVSMNGKLLVEKAYGFRDAAKTQPVLPDDPFRIASVGKPITAAAVRNLIAQGKLTLDTKAFPFLGIQPLAGATVDPRLNEITIQNLLEHKGGWDRDKAFDPMFRPIEIAKANGKTGPANQEDIIRYMLGKPLQHDPGKQNAYSNFGYCVLGRIIEKVTGQNYTSYIQKELLAPLSIRSIELGRTLTKDRNPREPVYADSGKGRNVMDPQSTELVPAADGTFNLEAMDSHGALISSAADLCRFMDAYWITGHPRKGSGQSWTHFGSLPGTFSMATQYANGVNVACLVNQRADASGLKYEKIKEMMEAAASQYAGSAPKYLAIWVKE